jgi:hypothetical protein
VIATATLTARSGDALPHCEAGGVAQRHSRYLADEPGQAECKAGSSMRCTPTMGSGQGRRLVPEDQGGFHEPDRAHHRGHKTMPAVAIVITSSNFSANAGGVAR